MYERGNTIQIIYSFYLESQKLNFTLLFILLTEKTKQTMPYDLQNCFFYLILFSIPVLPCKYT